MSSQSEAFALAVLNAFAEAGRYTDTEVAAAGGPSSTTMTKLRKAAGGEIVLAEPRNDTFSRIDTAARWRHGSARGLWRDGIDPVPAGEGGLASAIGGEQAKIAYSGLDGYLQSLQERITELEERVDLLESQAPPERWSPRSRATAKPEDSPAPGWASERLTQEAARHGRSRGRALREDQDTAGAESQDNGGAAGA